MVILYNPSNLPVSLKLGQNKKLKKNVPWLGNFTSESLPWEYKRGDNYLCTNMLIKELFTIMKNYKQHIYHIMRKVNHYT